MSFYPYRALQPVKVYRGQWYCFAILLLHETECQLEFELSLLDVLMRRDKAAVHIITVCRVTNIRSGREENCSTFVFCDEARRHLFCTARSSADLST